MTAQQIASLVPPPAPPTPTPNAAPSLNDWIERPGEAAAVVANQQVASALEPMQRALQGVTQMNAIAQRALAVRDFSDAFSKWGPEIDGHMAQVAPEQRTLDNYAKVVKFVQGNHLDEIVAERAKQLMAQGGLGERANGSNGQPGTVSSTGYQPDKLGALGELAKAKGMTEPMVVDFCRKNNMSVEKWMEYAQGGKMFTSAGPFHTTMTDEQLGIKGTFGDA